MNLKNSIKNYGIKGTLKITWNTKITSIIAKIINVFTKNKPLLDEIVIESHNDFDCNGGAFYNYLIKNGYNKKYKIIWLTRKKYKENLPQNVELVPLYGPSIKRAYHLCLAKYFSYDCEVITKIRKDQIVVYCSHGAGGFKNIKGKMIIPDFIDYILLQSPNYMPIQANQWSISKNDSRIVYIGYPSHDIFFNPSQNEMSKIIKKKYKKIILWMPTFRKVSGYNRNDSSKEQKLGIPLIDKLEEYENLNKTLEEKNIFLIIKLHPKQDLSALGIMDLSNIKVLTGETVKKLNIDNYNLIKYSDALISDYSGVAYEYLQLDRPIAYVLDDMKDYKNGFVVDDIHELIAGHEIYNYNDLISFLDDLSNDNDRYKNKRDKIRDYIYKYHDGKSCERLAKLLKL